MCKRSGPVQFRCTKYSSLSVIIYHIYTAIEGDSLKPGAGQNVATHALPTARNFVVLIPSRP